MALTLSQIIDQADELVPNDFTDSDKYLWLNEVNNRFFEAVKIPKSDTFTIVKNQASYVLATDIRARNIDLVRVGYQTYPSFLHDPITPGSVYHTFDDDTNTLALSEAPLQAGVGIVRYFRIATTTYTTSSNSSNPDAPAEYHFVYVAGLAQKIAAAQEDLAKANNYEAMFMGQLQVAAQNYARTV